MNINDKSIKYFHFTDRNNLCSILNNGLIPAIGKNAMGVEKSQKIFFSQGRESTLKCLDVWLRWFIVKYQRKKYIEEAVSGIDPNSSIENEQLYNQKMFEAINKHHLDTENRKIETDRAKLACFEKMYYEWRNKVYLSLDLVENVDFSYDDIDEVKEAYSKTVNDFKYIKYMYGNIQNIYGLEPWNMHTFIGKSISPNKINLITVNGKKDGISIVKHLYETEKQNNPNFKYPLLDEWMDFVKTKEGIFEKTSY